MPDPDQHSENSAQFQVGCSSVCDVVRKPKRRKRKSRPIHRLLGMLAAVPLIWVLLTGVLLNHSSDLGLDEIELKSPVVLSAYGMTPQGDPMSIIVGNHTVTAWDGIVFFDNEVLALEGELLTALLVKEEIAVVSDVAVLRIAQNGEVIEKLDELSLPNIPLLNAGLIGDQMALYAADTWYIADGEWLEFSETSAPDQQFSLISLEDGALKDSLSTQWAGGGISLSRFVLDLHSGNFLGSFANYFYDFVALCTLWLIGSGLVLQFRSSRRNKVSR